MRPATYHGLLTLGLLLLLAFPVAAQNRLTIDGTGDSQELLRTLARAFETANVGMRVALPDSVGSSGGVRALLKGKCDMARVARPLKARELAKASDLNQWLFAWSPVVIAANLPKLCVDNLSGEQLSAIFSGSISDWSKLGSCAANTIYVAQREEGDSSRTTIEQNLPAFASLSALAGRVIYSTPETVQILSENSYTIGYLPLSAINNNSLQILNFNGIAATGENVLNGSYPFSTPFGLVWRGELAGLAADFVAFIDSPAGQKIIRNAGAFPVTTK